MAAANAHYYATRDPLGRGGDFVTAPEVSQMFGELIGLALADTWLRCGRPGRPQYVELGPGRGTLAADALRAMRSTGLRPAVHFVETSPALRLRQAVVVPQAQWHESIDDLPEREPLLVVANEFFDALPVRQRQSGRERRVALEGGALRADPVERGALVEDCPLAQTIIATLSRRLAHAGGAALVIDFGYEGPAIGDTLQAVSDHRPVDPFSAPGEVDLTAHVDFAAVARAARAGGAQVVGPVAQGAWLNSLGIKARAAAMTRARPDRVGEIEGAVERLTGGGAMGEHFRVIALIAPGWPTPEGFT